MRTKDLKPTIIVDSREHECPLIFTQLPSIMRGLPTGDYTVLGFEDHFCVERKTISDLISSISKDNRARFERELVRMRGYKFKRLLIIGSRLAIELHEYRSDMHPNAVLGTLAAYEQRYDLPPEFAETPEQAALTVERWAVYFVREQVERARDVLRAAELATGKTEGDPA